VYIERTPATGLAVMPMAVPVLHLHDIPDEGLSLSCDVQADDLALGPEDARIPGGLAFSAKVTKTGTSVYVLGRLNGTVRRQCVRCLKDYDDPLRLPIVGEYHLDTDLKSRPSGRDSSERSGAKGDDEGYVYTGDEIELGSMLREQVLLATPMQPLCADACRGLCPVCGQDRNERRCECREQQISSPFAVLKKLRRTVKEPSKRTTKAK
jgi:uncharacterized protein